MKETSAGAIIFYIENNKPLYLILFRKASGRFKEHYGFVQGNVEADEKPEQTAIREAKEEAGLDIKLIPNFKEKIGYFYRKGGKIVSKEVIFFLAEAENKEIKLSSEHDAYFWLSLDDALGKIRFENQREILKKASEFINNIKQKRLI